MLKKIGAFVGSMALSAVALAAGPDTTALTAVATDIATVGGVMFGLYVAVKAVKFVRRAL